MYLCGMVWRVHSLEERPRDWVFVPAYYTPTHHRNERATSHGLVRGVQVLQGVGEGEGSPREREGVEERKKCEAEPSAPERKIKIKIKTITHLYRASTISRMSGADAGAAVRSVAADAEVRAAIRM
jgi:hypothetical protein